MLRNLAAGRRVKTCCSGILEPLSSLDEMSCFMPSIDGYDGDSVKGFDSDNFDDDVLDLSLTLS